MNPATQKMVDAVLEAMQPADELGGLDPAEYVRFMHAIAKAATERALAAVANDGIVRATASATMRNPTGRRGAERPAYCILDGQYAGSIFYASDEPTDFDGEIVVQFHPDSQHARAASWPHGPL